MKLHDFRAEIDHGGNLFDIDSRVKKQRFRWVGRVAQGLSANGNERPKMF